MKTFLIAAALAALLAFGVEPQSEEPPTVEYTTPCEQHGEHGEHAGPPGSCG